MVKLGQSPIVGEPPSVPHVDFYLPSPALCLRLLLKGAGDWGWLLASYLGAPLFSYLDDGSQFLS
ncbi:hypothetical protein ACU4GD_28305 [Cupriavidus basilensis]